MSAASFVLCVATCVRSVRTGDLLIALGWHAVVARSDPGLILVNVSRAGADDPPGWRYDTWPHAAGWPSWDRAGRGWWGRLGFGHFVGWRGPGRRVDQFVVPHYFVAVLAGLPPGMVLYRRLRARRGARPGLSRTDSS